MSIHDPVHEFPDQCIQAKEDCETLEIPTDWSIQDIIVCGMGGSALGAHVVQSAVPLKVPFTINNTYFLPRRVSENTLVFLVSYSGNTEEVLACAERALSKGCKIVGITSGGKLAKLLKENNLPAYIFDPKNNSTRQPRMGLAYTMISLMLILNKLNLTQENIMPDLEWGLKHIEQLRWNLSKGIELAAKGIKDRLILVFGMDYLVGNAHILSNQLNESAKVYSNWYAIPEVNHHLFEGLSHPKLEMAAIFLENPNCSPKNLKRSEVTREVLRKKGIAPIFTYMPGTENTPFISQTLITILYSTALSYKLAQEYGEDPLTVPNVDYFKEKLAG